MLDAMVTSTLEQKSKAAARPLSTLPGEAPTTLVAAPAPLIPNHPVLGTLPEDPDIIMGRLRDARREVEAILVSISKLEVMWGSPQIALAEVAATEAVLTEQAQARIDADIAAAASAGPQASKADQAKAARAASRVAAATGKDPAAAGEARAQQKAALLAAMLEGDPAEANVVAIKDAFAADFAAKQASAQAATFKPPVVVHSTISEDNDEPIPPPTAVGWQCPTHKKFVTRTSPRRKVEFRACPEQGCGEFEKV
jgi:hypothetical protein